MILIYSPQFLRHQRRWRVLADGDRRLCAQAKSVLCLKNLIMRFWLLRTWPSLSSIDCVRGKTKSRMKSVQQNSNSPRAASLDILPRWLRQLITSRVDKRKQLFRYRLDLYLFICVLLFCLGRWRPLRPILTKVLGWRRRPESNAQQRAIDSAPLADFNRIGPRTRLFTPSSIAKPGELTILCTWLGARPKYIARYVAMYTRIAPRARILLIESDVSILVSSYARQRRALKPAAKVVLDTLTARIEQSSQSRDSSAHHHPQPRILMHVFSNGGSNTATQLLLELRQQSSRPLHLSGMIVDSAPALGTYWKEYEAMMLSLPKGVVAQMMGEIAIHSLLGMLHMWIKAGNENPSALMRRILLDRTYVCGLPTAQGPDGCVVATEEARGNECLHVCYLYSEADALVDWRDIAAHAEIARRMAGCKVKEVVFQDTPHCRHFVGNEELYENAVSEMWSNNSEQL